ncbi:MAG: hypothetical protein IPO27_16545 [Bacteroidetes bacterium]|nr:hypothetical protein [Bacteroidota bacterium]
MKNRIVIFFIAIMIMLAGCRKQDGHPTWESGIAVPLIKTSLALDDIIKGDSLLQTNADSSISLVYKSTLNEFRLDSLFTLFDTSITRSYKLDSLSLYSQSLTYPVTLGEICSNAGFIGQIIIAQNGGILAIPPFTNISSGTQNINADTLFQTITLVTGFMDITLSNGLPVDITNLSIELKNKSNGVVIAQTIFPLIAAGTTETNTISLAGKTIEGNMTADLILNSPGSSGQPVLIDTSDALIAELKVYDLHPSTATAIWPQQDLVNKQQPFVLKVLKVELTEARIKSGYIKLDLFSTLQDSVRFEYALPLATLNGVSYKINHTLAPAQPGNVTQYSNTYDFTGYELDLTGINHDTVNTLWNALRASIDSTGVMKTISLTDSFYAQIGFVDLVPDYARGYLGQDTFDLGPNEVPLDIFKNFNNADFDLDDVTVSVNAENGIGIDAQVKVDQMQSINTTKANTVTLGGPALSNPLNIVRATDNGGSQPVYYTQNNLFLNKTNSNAPKFISNLPDKINTKVTLYTNPNGNVTNYNDFIYYSDGIRFNLNVEMPLNFMASNLVLCDTLPFSIKQDDISRIKSAILSIYADNGYPLEAVTTLYLLNNQMTIIDSVLSKAVLMAAPIAQNGVVQQKQKTRIDVAFDKDRMQKLFDAKFCILKTTFKTKPDNQHVKIYSDYAIDIRMTADFIYVNE